MSLWRSKKGKVWKTSDNQRQNLCLVSNRQEMSVGQIRELENKSKSALASNLTVKSRPLETPLPQIRKHEFMTCTASSKPDHFSQLFPLASALKRSHFTPCVYCVIRQRTCKHLNTVETPSELFIWGAPGAEHGFASFPLKPQQTPRGNHEMDSFQTSNCQIIFAFL